jgi:RNA polymerase sigma-70 factor (ECF subfamily)
MALTTSALIESQSALDAVRDDDATRFADLAEGYRRQLHLHCYRMLGSFEDAEDAVQDALLRAWKARQAFDGRAAFGTWLHRIATNASLDAIARRRRRPPTSSLGAPGEVAWLQPYPDRLLEPIAERADEPEAAVVERETIELAFVAAIQHLPPRQRAVLLARDVLGLTAAETGGLIDASQAAVNSALQRARATMRAHLPASRGDWRARVPRDDQENEVLARYIDAAERGDMAALAALLREDARFAMPPEPGVWQGRDVLIEAWTPALAGPSRWGDWHLVPTRANRQPAAAAYLRRSGGSVFRAMAVDVLRIEGGMITDITTFPPRVFASFGLPLELRPDRIRH